MQNAHILVTNDDGPHSPLLRPFLENIQKHNLGQLSFSIPNEEKSWTSQALSLTQDITATPKEIQSTKGFLLNATPAECVCIGAQNILDSKPSICLSGINIGTNIGMALYYNSGTLGAARQAVVCGMQAIAISVFLPNEVFQAYRACDKSKLESYAKQWEQIAHTASKLVAILMQKKAAEETDLISINLPWSCSLESKVNITRLARIGYKRLFVKSEGGTYRLEPDINQLTQEQIPKDEELKQVKSDAQAIKEGRISITPLQLDAQRIDWLRWKEFENELQNAFCKC